MNRESGRNEQRSDNRAMREVTEKIRKMKSLKEYSVEEFSKEGGDADRVSQELQDLTTTQLRRFYSEAKDIERLLDQGKSWKDVEGRFWRLQPQLAYAVGREEKIPQDFFKLMVSCLGKVAVGDEEERKNNYRVFMEFFEAVVAYHRYHRG